MTDKTEKLVNLMHRIIEVAFNSLIEFPEESEDPQRWAQTVLGLVIGVQLVARAANGGSLTCALRPETAHEIEVLSEVLIDTFVKQQKLGKGQAGVKFSQLLGRPPQRVNYLQPVRPGMEWRWVIPMADENTPMPEDLFWLLSEIEPRSANRVYAARVAQEVLALNGTVQFEADDQAQTSEELLCAAVAAAKWSLTLWGNQSRAAIVEYLAVTSSDRIFLELKAALLHKLEHTVVEA